MCISCNSTFDKIENLQVHIKSTHAEKKLSEESIQTDTTDLFKKESYSIIEPFIRKLDEGYMPFICILCNAPFNKIENCRNHVKRVHKNMKLEKNAASEKQISNTDKSANLLARTFSLYASNSLSRG